jgi:hypothetical protein
MGCICYESKERKRIAHQSVPIVLGSYIDFLIRGERLVIDTRAQWGTIILKGMLKYYSSFSTYDAMSLHRRTTKKEETAEWYLYVEDEGLALRYNNGKVTWTYKQNNFNSTAHGHSWVELVENVNPYVLKNVTDRTYATNRYLSLFKAIIQKKHNMNNLENRQILSGVALKRRFIDHEFAQRKKKKTMSFVKMSTVFESGTLTLPVSKRLNGTCKQNLRCKNQTYDNTLHDGRSNKVAHFLPTVNRSANIAVKNSKALEFADDARGFFCTLNTKDLKSAGEQHVFADSVIMTEKTDGSLLYQHLLKLQKQQESVLATGKDEIVIDGFLTGMTFNVTLNFLVALKRVFPCITAKFFRPFVMFVTKESIPIKYVSEIDCFFSPAEITEFNIPIKHWTSLSTTALQLPIESITKTQAAKCTVAINNIKGSVANCTSDLHEVLMKNSLGITCYMRNSQEKVQKILDEAVISTGEDTTHFQDIYHSTIAPLLTSSLQMQKDRELKMINAIRRMYPSDELLTSYKTSNTKGTPYIRNRRTSEIDIVKRYISIITNKQFFHPVPIWNIRLWAIFGNLHGACIEDGIVLDAKAAKSIPDIHYNACFVVEFIFKNVKLAKSATFVSLRRLSDASSFCQWEKETLVGCVVCETEPFVKNSNHCKVLHGKIGEHNYYLIHFLPIATNTYDKLNIFNDKYEKTMTVAIMGTRVTSSGVGTKFANAFGQKNVCALVTDLSPYWGITKDGKKVHAQIMYSDVSIVGRITAGQIMHMMHSEDLALGPRGEILAPIDLVVHAVNPYTNTKVFDIKVDTLTNINGFDAQALCVMSKALRNEKILQRVLQVIGFHGYSIQFVDI